MDEDTVLEPGEAFVIRATLPHPVEPRETFTLALTPPGRRPETMRLTVPPRVTPVTALS